MRCTVRLRLTGAALGLLLAAWGCAHEATVKRTVVLSPVKDANAGRPFYVLIRAVSEKEFLTDSYNTVAELVYPNSDDPTVLKVVLIWPSKEQRVEVQVPQEKGVGVYGVYTRPGNPWKVLHAPPLKSELRTVLKRRTVESN